MGIMVVVLKGTYVRIVVGPSTIGPELIPLF